MGIQETEQYLWQVGVKKAVVALMGFIASKGIVVLLQNYGVQVDSEKLQVELTAGGIGAFHLAHDYLKLKFFANSKWF